MEKNNPVIIFDFGNVLIDLDIPGFYENFQELTGLQTKEEKLMFEEIMGAYECGLISTELFLNRLMKLSPGKVQARELIQCWNSMLVGIRPDTLDLLRKLRNQYHTYILSNTNKLHIDWVHDHLRSLHRVEDFEKRYLHGAFYSHELKLAKPEPEIFRVVQSKIGVPSKDILFFDDLKENVDGARKAGWNAAVHPAGKSISETLQSFIILPQ